MKNLSEEILSILKKGSVTGVADAIIRYKESGLDRTELQDQLYKVLDNVENSELKRYEDDIEDFIAALEGYCSSEYKLHPSQLWG